MIPVVALFVKGAGAVHTTHLSTTAEWPLYLYSAFIIVPHTPGAQVQTTEFYLHITPYLPLPRKRSPDGASQTEVADI